MQQSSSSRCPHSHDIGPLALQATSSRGDGLPFTPVSTLLLILFPVVAGDLKPENILLKEVPGENYGILAKITGGQQTIICITVNVNSLRGGRPKYFFNHFAVPKIFI